MKKLILLLLLISVFANAQDIKKLTQPAQRDTIYIIKEVQNDSALLAYQEILEKTNSQLSLWFNPYGILIASLGILFTILAIAATIFIYLQSKEYKELIQDSLDKHKIVLGKLVEEKNQQLKSIEADLDKTINEYKEKLNNATDENKKEITEVIEILKAQKESVDKKIDKNFAYHAIINNSPYLPAQLHTCLNCGHAFVVNSGDHGILSIAATRPITCPRCQNINYVTARWPYEDK